jgi:hypothetical protein
VISSPLMSVANGRRTATPKSWESGINWGPSYRIYLARDGEKLIVLFGGGTKRRQQRDINAAKELLIEYNARKTNVKNAPSGEQRRRKKE